MKKSSVVVFISISIITNALAYYQAEQGRWLNRDPIQESGGVNLYNSFNNNPISIIDLYGLDPIGEQISGEYWHDWWWQLRPWDNPNDVFSINDGAGNTMAELTDKQMDNYYRSLVEGKELTTCWQTFQVEPGDTGRSWWIAANNGIDFSDAGFWLNQAHSVEVTGGSFEYRKNPDSGKLEVQNSSVSYKWYDEIDSNPCRNDPLGQTILETINIVPEWLTGADFQIEIQWQDNRTSPRTVE